MLERDDVTSVVGSPLFDEASERDGDGGRQAPEIADHRVILARSGEASARYEKNCSVPSAACEVAGAEDGQRADCTRLHTRMLGRTERRLYTYRTRTVDFFSS